MSLRRTALSRFFRSLGAAGLLLAGACETTGTPGASTLSTVVTGEEESALLDLAPAPLTATGVERLPVPALEDTEVYEVELNDAVDFVDGSPDISDIQFDGLETVTVTPKVGKRLGFQPGRILLSRNGLFARKVTGVVKTALGFRFKTVPATLTEIFKKVRIEGFASLQEAPASKPGSYGTLSSALKIVWADIASSKEKSKSWSLNKKVLDGSTLDVSVGGDFDIDYKFYLKIYIATGDEDVVKSYVRIEADSDVWAKVVASASASSGSKEHSFASWEMAWSFGAVSGILDLDFVMNYSASVSGAVTATMDVGFQNLEYKVGAEWVQGDGWDKVTDYDAPTWSKDFDVSAKVDATVKIQPAIEAAVLIYGVAGPEIALGPELTGHVNAQASSSSYDLCADVDVALKADANFVVDIFGLIELAEKNFGSWTLYTWSNVYSDCW